MQNNKIKAFAAFVLALGGAEVDAENARRKHLQTRTKRRFWVKQLFLDRDTCGYYAELCNMDGKLFKSKMLMSRSDFDFLLQRVAPHIRKQNTNMRNAIGPAQRLAVTIRYLATGASMHIMSENFRLSPSSVFRIVHETCPVIYATLKAEFFKIPRTESEWLQIAHKFENRWNFPNCVGALDGKRILIQTSHSSGSEHVNHKHINSIVLIAMVDAEYKFTYIDVGALGRPLNSDVFARCLLAKELEENSLKLPPPTQLFEGSQPVPYVLAADDAFPLKPYIMKPYPLNSISFRQQVMSERVFNYRLARARGVAETAFGIVAARFRILRRPIDVNVDKSIQLVRAICTLHNFLIARNGLETADIDHEVNEQFVAGSWRKHCSAVDSLDRPSPDATAVRKEFEHFFTTPQGELSGQYETILRNTMQANANI